MLFYYYSFLLLCISRTTTFAFQNAAEMWSCRASILRIRMPLLRNPSSSIRLPFLFTDESSTTKFFSTSSQQALFSTSKKPSSAAEIVESSFQDPRPQLTVDDLFKISTALFQSHSIPEPEDSAMYLLCHVAGIHSYRRSDFINQKDLKFSNPSKHILQFKSHCQARLDRCPVQYIIGNWDFYALNFLCEAPVLIPRPETEELVENILSTDRLHSLSNLSILDIGCGTGAIGISLLFHLPNARCMALDINPIAIDLATKNAKRLLKDSSDRYLPLLKSFEEFSMPETFPNTDQHSYDIIVSNPPYIPSTDMLDLDAEVKL